MTEYVGQKIVIVDNGQSADKHPGVASVDIDSHDRLLLRASNGDIVAVYNRHAWQSYGVRDTQPK